MAIEQADSARPAAPSTDRSRTLLIALLLSLITLAAYAGVAENLYAFDDDVYVTTNDHIASGLTPSSFAWALQSGYAANWHPLTWMSHALDVDWFALQPAGHHLTNLLLHLANTLLVFFVLRALTSATWRSATWRSALVAALFAVHPLHVESVAWISERKDVLSTFFWLATTAAYVGYARCGGALRYALVLACFALGLLAKQMLVTLPFALVLLDVWPLGKISLRPRKVFGAGIVASLRQKIPMFALATAASVATFVAQSHSGAVGTLTKFPLHSRLENALVSYVMYLWKLFVPVDLSAFYPYQSALAVWQVVGAILMLAAITFAALRVIDKRPYLAVGWFFYLGTLVPVIGLIQIGNQSMADRYTYVPALGIFIAASWLTHEIALRSVRARIGVSAAWVLALCALTLTTIRQVRVWKDDESLFTHALEIDDANYLAHDGLGYNLIGKKRVDEAVPHFEAALRAKPDFAISHSNLGRYKMACGDFQDAVEHLRQATKSAPESGPFHLNLALALAGAAQLDEARMEFDSAVRLDPHSPATADGLGMALAHLGTLFIGQGRMDPARVLLARAVEVAPQMPDAELSLGHTLAWKGEAAEAALHYQRALDLHPDPARDYYAYGKSVSAQAHFGLGNTLAARGQLAQAEAEYRKSIALAPGFSQAVGALAWLLATAEEPTVFKPDEAFELAQRVTRWNAGKDSLALDALGAAFACRGDFAAALRYATLAMHVAVENKNDRLAQNIAARIVRYETKLTFRQAAIPLVP